MSDDTCRFWKDTARTFAEKYARLIIVNKRLRERIKELETSK